MVTDLSDQDLKDLTRLAARLCAPSEPHERDSWPDRVSSFWHSLAAGLDEEMSRRQRMVQELRDSTDEGGVGSLVGEDDEDLSGWVPDTGDAA
jgi:hypothetical protein